jgi:D-threo-aldose 1-dehydrogenase
MRQYEDSLQRLGSGRVEALVIHDIEEAEGQLVLHPRGSREWLTGAQGGYKALEELRRVGKIKAFGAGLNYAVGTPNHAEETYRQWNVEYLDFLIDQASEGERKLDFLLLAGTYSLLNMSAWEDGILQKCLDNHIGVVLGGAFATGILATGAVRHSVCQTTL